jgi:hypothetical protein
MLGIGGISGFVFVGSEIGAAAVQPPSRVSRKIPGTMIFSDLMLNQDEFSPQFSAY